MSAAPPRPLRCYGEDFVVGSVRDFGAMPVTREATLALARGWGMYRMKKAAP